MLLYLVEYITTGLGYTGAREAITPLITTPTGAKRFRISDHLASLRVEIAPGGTSHYDYDPWGALTQVTGTGTSRLTFNDRQRDPESGDLNLGRRQDDAVWGRFNSIDPLWSRHPEESPYAYASNNPLRYTDPTGMQARTVQVPFEDGGEGVPSPGAGGGSIYEVYLANHPEQALQYEPLEGGGRSDEGAGRSEKGDEDGTKNEGSERSENATLQSGESVQTAEQTAKASAKAQDQMERNSSSRKASKIDRVAFKAEREAFWKKEAVNNADKYNTDDLARMKKGRAPMGSDGYPMELHHVDGTPQGGVEPMTRTDHRLGDNYKKNHP